jgi:hypothetical protein
MTVVLECLGKILLLTTTGLARALLVGIAAVLARREGQRDAPRNLANCHMGFKQAR